MPSLSPGDDSPTNFAQILPGAPNAGPQSITSLSFRWKRYVVYISGQQLNILRSPTELVQAIHFDGELTAVCAERGDNGKIAVASAQHVWVLVPRTSAWSRVSWALELLLKREDAGDEARTLCWDEEGELLVGGSRSLSLFGTLPSSRTSAPSTPGGEYQKVEERSALWCKSIATPVRYAEFSPRAGLIATCGSYDKLVKIWRRLSYEDGVFDHAYLPHDGIVTSVEWRHSDPPKFEADDSDEQRIKSYHGPDEECEVLYTLASDAKLRIWRTNGNFDLDLLTLYNVVDLVSAIPHSPILTMNGASHFQRPARYAFVLPSGSYCTAVAAAVRKQQLGQVSHSIEHLKEVSSKTPDVIVTLDSQGRMSAWGLSSIGHKRRPDTPTEETKEPFHISHIEGLGLKFDQSVPTAFETWFDGDMLNILVHSFGRSVNWWRGNIEQFSNSGALSNDRGEQIAQWSGSHAAIGGIRATHGLDKLLSWTKTGEIDEWSSEGYARLTLSKSLSLGEQILDADSVQRDKSLVSVGKTSLTFSRVTDEKGAISTLHSLKYSNNVRLLRLEDKHSHADAVYLAYDAQGRFCIVEVNPTRGEWHSAEPIIDASEAKQLPLVSGSHGDGGSLVDVTAVIHPRKSSWLRLVGLYESGLVLRRDVAVSALLGSSGNSSERTLTFATRFANASLFTANCDCAAIASAGGRDLLLLDLKDGYVEHQQILSAEAKYLRFPQAFLDDPVRTEHGVLAVASDEAVDVFARTRYDQMSSKYHHRWALIKRISIAGTGLDISSVDWLSEGRLALAAGNSIYVADNKVMAKQLGLEERQRMDLSVEDLKSIPELIDELKGSFTVWQPAVLQGLILHSHFASVVHVLTRLEEKLRFFAKGDVLSPTLELDVHELFSTKSNLMVSTQEDTFSELRDQLNEIDLPLTSDADQERLKTVVRTVSYVQRHLQSLDANAVKYLFLWRYQALSDDTFGHLMTNGTLNNGHSNENSENNKSRTVPTMDWRAIAFAYHSSTQQPLLEILNLYYENKLDWQTVRSLGITSWLHNIKAAQSEGSGIASLEQVFDALGQNAYRSSQPPDPVNASLFLLALRKKPTLLALWRVAIGNREQKNTQNFLKRDFDAEANRTAARKNAYALMGKRRFEYAAAFFILANDPQSAISILAGQCEDIQLAVAVARVFCADGSPVLKKFLQERVVPTAIKSGDRWMLSWAYEIMGLSSEAAGALIVNLESLAEDPSDRPPRTWKQDDPAALTLYHELRDSQKRTETNKSITRSAAVQDEYRAVLRAARILRRTGLWLLALDLVSTWSFPRAVTTSREDDKDIGHEELKLFNGVHEDDTNGVLNMLDAFDGSTSKTKASKPPEAVSSILDSFQAPEPNPTAVEDTDSRAAKAAEMLAKIRAKSEQKKDVQSKETAGASAEEKKAKPTQFKEPAASSILDSFGF